MIEEYGSPASRMRGLRRRSLLVGRGLMLATALVLLTVQIFGFGRTARADSPSSEGWWTSANPGSVGGVGAPAPPSDVPSNGLLIEGGPTTSSGAGDSGASAYAALSYDLPDGATVGKLTLTVAPNSATTPSATLELCPLTTQSFQAEDGGPMSDAPSYSCARNTTAPQTSGSYQFDVSTIVSSGGFAVAILPTSPSDRVVLSQPDSKSLEVRPPVDTTASSLASSPGDTGSSSGFSSAAGPYAGNSPGVGSAPLNIPGDMGAPTPSAPGVAVAPLPSAPASSSFAQPVSTANPVASANAAVRYTSPTTSSGPTPWVGIVFLAVLLLAAALWMGAGRLTAAEQPPATD